MTNACLIYKIENISKKVFLLPQEVVEFGRDKSNDVKLALYPLEEISFQWATTDISRKHFKIQRKNSKYVIEDVKSTNGTSIDCIAVLSSVRELRDKQLIDVGGVLELKSHVLQKNLLLKRITNKPEEEYLLFEKNFTMGTSPESDIFIGKEVRNQVNIFNEHDEYFIKPTEENSEIYVNDVSIKYNEKTPLCQEAKISISNINIFFEIILEKRNNV